MSEEKKAIEWLKNNLKISIELGEKYGFEEAIKSQTTILNLIEKQQEEIKTLKKITRCYNSYSGNLIDDTAIIIADSRYFLDGTFVNNYISKGKIRELINNNQDDIDYSIHDIIEDLKDLLKEV